MAIDQITAANIGHHCPSNNKYGDQIMRSDQYLMKIIPIPNGMDASFCQLHMDTTKMENLNGISDHVHPPEKKSCRIIPSTQTERCHKKKSPTSNNLANK